MITAFQLAVVSAGVFFLNALLTGIWKYLEISSSKEAKAHIYVDISHRASLMYSFSTLLVAYFVELSQLSNTVELIATSFLVTYFSIAIIGYMVRGYLKDTENQFINAKKSVTWFMWSLIVAEIGGFLVIFYGVLIEIF